MAKSKITKRLVDALKPGEIAWVCIGTIDGPAIGASNAHRRQPVSASQRAEITGDLITDLDRTGGSTLHAD